MVVSDFFVPIRITLVPCCPDLLRLYGVVERHVMRIGAVLQFPLAQPVLASCEFFSSWTMWPSPCFHDW